MKTDQIRKQTNKFLQGYLDEINQITQNASDIDKAGKWGVDGWIVTIHDLFDLQVRTFATVLRAGIAGPWWAATESPDAPIETDPITVEQTNYPRKLNASTFKRVGLPTMTIPPYSLGFEPEILPAGFTEYRIVLKDDRFLGANYKGTVFLTATSGTAEPDQMEVVVGL
ncbi:hypothetical protein [Mycobacterium hubeiense]|uniref:hypothetical protein n=1 Tax=Mycobacterium hubeiense TaxID=1867256 RepID=UPI000C7F6C86|nr:hypothetical protein [Mycobacterium sp. QGD 101]